MDSGSERRRSGALGSHESCSTSYIIEHHMLMQSLSAHLSVSRMYRYGYCFLHGFATTDPIKSFGLSRQRQYAFTSALALPSMSSSATLHDENRVPPKETWLVVGDGDLSFGAWLVSSGSDANGSGSTQAAPSFHPQRHALIATVLEDEQTHARIYKNSTNNVATILAAGQTVQFGVDATKLHEQYSMLFDRIVFNFPHWRGKANIRRNRALIDAFLASASQVLRDDESEIHIALRPHQGGCVTSGHDDDLPTLDTWKSSWMPHVYGAAYNLLLHRVKPFRPQYDLSSHRGVDRPFAVGDTAQTYVLGRSTGAAIRIEWQVAYRHELRLILDPVKLGYCEVSQDALQEGDVVPQLVNSCVPPGIASLVPLRAVIAPKKRDHSLLVFLVVYCGERSPLKRTQADSIRAAVETKAKLELGLDIAKEGRLVSRPFSRHLLEGLLKDAQERS